MAYRLNSRDYRKKDGIREASQAAIDISRGQGQGERQGAKQVAAGQTQAGLQSEPKDARH